MLPGRPPESSAGVHSSPSGVCGGGCGCSLCSGAAHCRRHPGDRRGGQPQAGERVDELEYRAEDFRPGRVSGLRSCVRGEGARIPTPSRLAGGAWMASRRKAPSRQVRKARTSATPAPAGVREQLAATAGILRALASAPGNLQAVLDAVTEQAARVCGATDSLIHRVDGDHLRLMAHYGPIPVGTPTGAGCGPPISNSTTQGLARRSTPPPGSGSSRKASSSRKVLSLGSMAGRWD